ncbi:MAG: hypothetical protein AB9903_34340 [Vulcanimicrobiota bacterium]
MSRKRYISNEISTDVKVLRLASKGGLLALLLYTWLIPHAEDDGTVTANPAEIVMRVIPCIRNVSIEEIQKAIDSIIDTGLMTIENEKLCFPLDNFFKHQSNIGKDKIEFLVRGGTLKEWNEIRRDEYRRSISSAAKRNENENTASDEKLLEFGAPSPSPSPSPSLSDDTKVSSWESADVNMVNVTVPFKEIKDLWNSICGGTFGSIISLSDNRKKHVKARWNEHPDLEYWRSVCNKLLTAEHCLGKSPGGWKANFDFIMKNNNGYTKLMEGGYDKAFKKGEPQKDVNERRGVSRPEEFVGGIRKL